MNDDSSEPGKARRRRYPRADRPSAVDLEKGRFTTPGSAPTEITVDGPLWRREDTVESIGVMQIHKTPVLYQMVHLPSNGPCSLGLFTGNERAVWKLRGKSQYVIIFTG